MNIRIIATETFGNKTTVGVKDFTPQEYEATFNPTMREVLDAGQVWSQTYEDGVTVEWERAPAIN